MGNGAWKVIPMTFTRYSRGAVYSGLDGAALEVDLLVKHGNTRPETYAQ